MIQSLRCQFGDLAVDITCSDTAVYHMLHHHFQYCLTTTTLPLAHYHLEQTATNWQLHLDQTILHKATMPLALFEPLLQDALQRLIAPQQQHLIFHAGSVSLAEQGVILCGQTGTGKSTLVAQLILSGFTYLTDEVVACSLGTSDFSGFARPLVLKSGSKFLWQDAAAHEDVLLLPDGVTWLAPTFLGNGSVRYQTTPKLLIFPHYEANHLLEIRPLSPAESAFQLMQHLVNARNLPQHGLPTVKRLAQTIPAYDIYFSDGLAVVAWIRQQLEQ